MAISYALVRPSGLSDDEEDDGETRS